MRKIKTLFVSRVVKLTKDLVYDYSKLPYTKVVLFYMGKKELDIKHISKVEIMICNNFNELNKQINALYTNYLDYKIIPEFSGDNFSKYSIKCYNKTFDTKIDPKIFKEKDKMTEFLGDIASKKYKRYIYKDLVSNSYDDISKIVGDTFIVKPTNASSSTNTFKIQSNDDFDSIKGKLARSYDYIIEEYIGGNLFSLDFFFDGKNMFLLVLAREVAMVELSDKNKFSKKFIEKYGDELFKHFNFILPLAYHMDFSKLSSVELGFLESIRAKLEFVGYRGVIHLEYKYDPKTKKIGFLEWGARYGGYRKNFIKNIYNTSHLRIPFYLLVENDYSRFTRVKGSIYKFKEKEYNLNFIRVKTNFIDTLNYVSILKKTGDVFKNSFYSFLKNYYKNNFGISVKKIDFFVKYDKNNNFFPFYQNSSTKFDYILELNDENFAIFKKKKFKIIEQTFFHEYK